MTTYADAMEELRTFVVGDRLLHFVVLDGYPFTLELRDKCVCIGVKEKGHTHLALPVGAAVTFGSLSPQCPFRSMRIVAEVTHHVRERVNTPAAAVVVAGESATALPSYAEVVICMRPVRVALSHFVASTANDPAWQAHNTNVQRTVSLVACANRTWERSEHLTPSPCVDYERKPFAFLSRCSLPGSVVPLPRVGASE
jgi:hypothetical protein